MRDPDGFRIIRALGLVADAAELHDKRLAEMFVPLRSRLSGVPVRMPDTDDVIQCLRGILDDPGFWTLAGQVARDRSAEMLVILGPRGLDRLSANEAAQAHLWRQYLDDPARSREATVDLLDWVGSQEV